MATGADPGGIGRVRSLCRQISRHGRQPALTGSCSLRSVPRELFEGGLSAEQLVDARSSENLEQRLDGSLDLATYDVAVDVNRVDAGNAGEIRQGTVESRLNGER